MHIKNKTIILAEYLVHSKHAVKTGISKTFS